MRFFCCIYAALSLAMLCGCASYGDQDEPESRKELLNVEGIPQMGAAYEGGKPLTPISGPEHPPRED